MNIYLKYFLSISIVLLPVLSFAQTVQQNRKIDSLRSILNSIYVSNTEEIDFNKSKRNTNFSLDTIRIKNLDELAFEIKDINPDTAIFLCEEALKIANTHLNKLKNDRPAQLKIQRLMTRPLDIIGSMNYFKGNYTFALNSYLKSLKIKEDLNNRKGIASTLSNLGNVYSSQGDLAKALVYYNKALKIGKELKETYLIAAVASNLGDVYCKLNDFTKALEYFNEAFKLSEQIGDIDGNAHNLSNIGFILERQAKQKKSEGKIHESDSLFGLAQMNYFKALEIDRASGNKYQIASDLGVLGSFYADINQLQKAEKYFLMSIEAAESINAIDLIRQTEEILSELYEKTGQLAKALDHYKKFIVAKDSVFNEENTKKAVASEMNFEFEKKQAIAKSEQEKKDALAMQEKEKQKNFLILVFCFLVVVAVFASFMFNRWRITQKQKSVIEKQKEKIVDSITYAQLIQQSILIEEAEIQEHLPDSFIYYQPKDIVSGDFYWFAKVNGSGVQSEYSDGDEAELLIIAAIDCTGHGIPGAFMSMIGNTLLNQIVNKQKITTPSEILKMLHQGITEALQQEKEGALSRDGMDIALCSIDLKNSKIQYAGAQNPLYVLKDGELEIIKADRQTVGGDNFRRKNTVKAEYANHIISIQKGMKIYLFTDGYMDQFGGPERKKIGTQNFKDLIIKYQHADMQHQKEIFANTITKWKGNTSQTDDILVIGINFSHI